MPIDTDSYKNHDAHYVSDSVEDIRKINEKRTEHRDQHRPDQPLGEMIEQHKEALNIAVDVGSGHGWISQLLAQDFDKIYSIEPSEAAQNIAKQLYPLDEIEWICGFAEDELNKLKLEEPALFVTSCVFSHLDDETVVAICKAIDSLSKSGSVLSLSENWSLHDKAFAQKLWHSRTEEWWQKQFPGWVFDFRQKKSSTGEGSFKGLTAVKG